MKKIFYLTTFLLGATSVFCATPSVLDGEQSIVFREQTHAFVTVPIVCQTPLCTSSALRSNFAFDTFVVEWPAGEYIRVRFFENGAWSEWLDTEGEIDVPDHEEDAQPYQLFMTHGATQYQLQGTHNSIHGSRVTYFIQPHYRPTKDDRIRMAFNETPSDVAIQSRNQWLDNGIELASYEREKLWATSYDGVKKIILHHTATTIKDINNDGVINQQDYREAVRAIYSYHARSRRWGDLGYNYIIDPDGTIWEGRYGGEGSIGGHAHRDLACKKFGKSGIGFNAGTIGIAVLGTYEEEDITPQAKESLTSLIARKSWEFEFEPAGKSYFVDGQYANVLGHRDVDCTTCPGEKLHAYLPVIIEQAQQKYQWYTSSQPRLYNAEILDATSTTVELREGEEKIVTVRFRNTGTISWHNYGDTTVHVASEQIKNHIASLDSIRLAAIDDKERATEGNATTSPLQYSVARLTTPNVRPGEVGTFAVIIKDPPKDFIEERTYVLALGSRGWIPRTDLVVEVVNTGLPFASTLMNEDSAQEALLDEEKQQAMTLRFQNRGTIEWKKGDITLAMLSTDDPTMSVREKSWKQERGNFVFTENVVPPGSIATFSVPIAPRRIGDVTNTIFLQKGKEKVVGSDRAQLHLMVTPAYAVELVSSTIPSVMLNAWRPHVGVTVKNVGVKAWDAATLKSMANAKGSLFTHPSWKSKSEIDQTGVVASGSIATFLFQMKPPSKEGAYKEKLALTQGKRTIYFLTDVGFQKEMSYDVRVDEVKKSKKKK